MTLSVHLVYTPEPDALERLRSDLAPSVRLSFGPGQPNPAGYDILVAGRPSREQVEASPNLRALIIPFAGLPTITRDLMNEYPHISVHNLHHNAAPTAEMALALMLSAAKLLLPSDRDFRRHDWTPRYRPTPSLLLMGKTALILGYGAVGQRVGAVCQALGMKILGIRRRTAAPEANVFTPDALHDLLPRADVLIICLPGTDETANLIGEKELALMPPGSVLVNVGRGVVVDQTALYNALKAGHLHAAGLDVWYHYPSDNANQTHTPPADVSFHELDNVVMSPHRAGAGGTMEIEQMRMAALAEMLNLADEGEPLPHRIDLEAGY